MAAASFEKQLAQFQANTMRKINLAYRKIAFEVFKEVILMSPVDTGRFRGNWQVAINGVPQGILDTLDPAGQISIRNVKSETDNLFIGNTIWLVNNLPYAVRLEHGWSKQAPSGMVQLTVQRWQPIVAQVGNEIARMK